MENTKEKTEDKRQYERQVNAEDEMNEQQKTK